MKAKEHKWVFSFSVNKYKCFLGVKSMFYNTANEHFSVVLQQ